MSKIQADETSSITCEGIKLADLRDVLGQAQSVTSRTLLAEVDAMFRANVNLCGVLVEPEPEDAGHPHLESQAIFREEMNRLLARQYFRELFYEKPISRLIETAEIKPMTVPDATPLATACTAMLNREAEDRDLPIIVKTSAGERFLLDAHDLLRLQNEELSDAVALIQTKSRELVEAGREREKMQQALISASRDAGKAEVATSILHNVGNVLNTVRTSASVLQRQNKGSKVTGISKAIDLLDEHQEDLAQFLLEDEKGRVLPGYLIKAVRMMEVERQATADELENLSKSIDHVAAIVAAQQDMAKGVNAQEAVRLQDLIDEALLYSKASIERHGVIIVNEITEQPAIISDRHLLVQIVINLVTNACQSVRDYGKGPCEVRLRLNQNQAGDMLVLEVEDTGLGIEPENLDKIFQFGFTTKDDGHGFGLHHAANTVAQLGGTLQARSEGPGRGATFTLALPKKLPAGETHTPLAA